MFFLLFGKGQIWEEGLLCSAAVSKTMLFPRVGHSPGRCAWRPDLAKRRTRSQSQGGGGGRASNMLVVLLITGEIPHILVHKFIARGGRRRSQQSSSESHEQEKWVGSPGSERRLPDWIPVLRAKKEAAKSRCCCLVSPLKCWNPDGVGALRSGLVFHLPCQPCIFLFV